MSIEEYWTGQGTDFSKIWNDYNNGMGYIEKFNSRNIHLIRLTFEYPQKNWPLFNHEAIYKTIKGYAHEVKLACFSERDYNFSVPIFLYGVERGSAVWEFAGELRSLLLLGTTLSDEKTIGQQIDNLDKKLEFLKKYFGDNVRKDDFEAFVKARSVSEINGAVLNLKKHANLVKTEITQQPISGDIQKSKESYVEVKRNIDRKV